MRASSRVSRGVHAANAKRSASAGLRRSRARHRADCGRRGPTLRAQRASRFARAGDGGDATGAYSAHSSVEAGRAASRRGDGVRLRRKDGARASETPIPANGITAGGDQGGNPQRVPRRRGQRERARRGEHERREDAAEEDARENRAQRDADDRLEHYCCPLALSSSSRRRSSSLSSTASDSSRFRTSSRGEPSKKRERTCVTTLRCASSRATTAL